jgi:uncharacterized protein YggT (Ycf19 family)
MKSFKFPTVAEFLLSITYTILGFVSILLLFRIVLRLFGASTAAPFVNWIYDTTESLISPFVGMFPAPTIDGTFVIEFSAIFALLVYVLIAFFIESIIHWLKGLRVEK